MTLMALVPHLAVVEGAMIVMILEALLKRKEHELPAAAAGC